MSEREDYADNDLPPPWNPRFGNALILLLIYFLSLLLAVALIVLIRLVNTY